MTTRGPGTEAFYKNNADAYATRERHLPKRRLDAFLSALPLNGAVLELGCGGGQDSAYMTSQGFDVTATDGSAELAAYAEKRIGKPVQIMRFDELDAIEAYDGVWAEASLLHVPRTALAEVFARIRRALRGDGILHASFKAGETDGFDTLGRYYNYPSAEWLESVLAAGGWRNVSVTRGDGGGYDGRPTKWLFARAQK